MLLPEGNTIHNSLVRYNKTVYNEISVLQVVSRRSALTVKCSYGNVSVRLSVRRANCPYGDVSLRLGVLTAKCPYDDVSVR